MSVHSMHLVFSPPTNRTVKHLDDILSKKISDLSNFLNAQGRSKCGYLDPHRKDTRCFGRCLSSENRGNRCNNQIKKRNLEHCSDHDIFCRDATTVYHSFGESLELFVSNYNNEINKILKVPLSLGLDKKFSYLSTNTGKIVEPDDYSSFIKDWNIVLSFLGLDKIFNLHDQLTTLIETYCVLVITARLRFLSGFVCYMQHDNGHYRAILLLARLANLLGNFLGIRDDDIYTNVGDDVNFEVEIKKIRRYFDLYSYLVENPYLIGTMLQLQKRGTKNNPFFMLKNDIIKGTGAAIIIIYKNIITKNEDDSVKTNKNYIKSLIEEPPKWKLDEKEAVDSILNHIDNIQTKENRNHYINSVNNMTYSSIYEFLNRISSASGYKGVKLDTFSQESPERLDRVYVKNIPSRRALDVPRSKFILSTSLGGVNIGSVKTKKLKRSEMEEKENVASWSARGEGRTQGSGEQGFSSTREELGRRDYGGSRSQGDGGRTTVGGRGGGGGGGPRERGHRRGRGRNRRPGRRAAGRAARLGLDPSGPAAGLAGDERARGGRDRRRRHRRAAGAHVGGPPAPAQGRDLPARARPRGHHGGPGVAHRQRGPAGADLHRHRARAHRELLAGLSRAGYQDVASGRPSV